MPIRFRCEHCRQRLTVSERKAGAMANCPKCHQRIQIPSDPGGEAGGPAEESSSAPPADGDASADSTPSHTPTGDAAATSPADSDLFSFADSTAGEATHDFHADQWVFDDGEPVGRFDPTKVAVSRHMLFMQGVLIAAVGVVCLLLGIMIGQLTAPRAVATGPKPCVIQGTVKLAKAGRDAFPDIGSLAVALPVEQRPNRNAKISIESLRPGGQRPQRNDPSIRAIRSLGGDVAMADANGRFQLKLPDEGKYFVLVLSNNADRGPNEELDKRDLMQMGSYLLYPNELLGDRKYEWKNRTVRGNEQLNLTFENL